MSAARLILATIFCLGVAFPASGQSSAQRTVLEAFRDSLDRTIDSAGLARLEVRLVDRVRKDRTSVLDHLRLGFLALRQAELSGPGFYEDAATEFQWVTRVARSWPYGWYGLGLAEHGLALSRATRPSTAGARPFTRAQAAFARALALDPGLAEMMEGEALALRRLQPSRASVLLDAVRLASMGRGSSPVLLPVLGRLEREFGDPQAALKAFEVFLPRSGAARGLTLLEVARTRFLLGRADGEAPYYEGAGLNDTVTVHAYRRDLALVAAGTELRAYDLAEGPARVAYLRTFWRIRDAAELRREGERLREHYRRVYLARRTWPAGVPVQGRDPSLRIALREPAVDDRGAIFIRHGEPDDRVRMSALGIEPNESWRYATDEGDRVVHFVARRDPEVFRLVESLFDVSQAPDVAGGGAPEQATRGGELLLRSRATLSPLYSRADRSGGDSARDFRLAERAMSRASLVAATTSDSYRPRLGRSLAARFDIVVLEGDSGRALLNVAYAVPFDSLHAAWLAPGVEYPLALRLGIFTPNGQPLVAVDSTVRPVAVTAGSDRWLTGMIAVPVPSGRLRMRVRLQDGDEAGTESPVRSLEVAPAAASAIGLSDLALGDPTGRWPVALPGREPVALNPLGRFTQGDRVELAYQVTAPDRSDLVSQVTLMRVDEQAGVIRSDRFQEPGGPSPRVVRHPVDVRRLKPGAYRLEVTVTDGQGGLARRWKEFVLTDSR